MSMRLEMDQAWLGAWGSAMIMWWAISTGNSPALVRCRISSMAAATRSLRVSSQACGSWAAMLRYAMGSSSLSRRAQYLPGSARRRVGCWTLAVPSGGRSRPPEGATKAPWVTLCKENHAQGGQPVDHDPAFRARWQHRRHWSLGRADRDRKPQSLGRVASSPGSADDAQESMR